ncbi:hypothetical protein ACFQ07_09600, partial [Actinomadura adrarensis]
RAGEFRMTRPDDLLERVAHFDAEYTRVIVPDGVDVAPPRKPRKKKDEPDDPALWTSAPAAPSGPVDEP